jgi:hypothetical protein
MALRDLTLNFEDKTITNEFLKNKKLVLQKVILALQCWTGDWFLDGTYGIPYGLRLDNKALLLADMQDIILNVDGVVSVQDLSVKITYEGERKTQKVFEIYALIVTEDDEQVILNGLVPIVGV